MRSLASFTALALVACTREPPPAWLDLLAKPCALAVNGQITCWNQDTPLGFDRIVPPASPTTAVSLQSEIIGVLRGLDAAGTPLLFACLDLPYELCPALDGPAQRLMDYGLLRPNGELVLDDNHDLIEVSDRVWSVAADSQLAAIDQSRTLFFPAAPHLTLNLPNAPLSITADSHGEIAGACVLDDTGSITCTGNGRWSEPFFDDPPYRRMEGSKGGVCALKGESTLICNDGNTYDWGPIRDLAVAGYSIYDEEGTTVDRNDVDVSVCVLLEDGSLRCAGPRYSQEMLEQLEE